MPACERDLPASRNCKDAAITQKSSDLSAAEKNANAIDSQVSPIPACLKGFELGQTAFVVGSHHLEAAARIMTGEKGQVELLANLVRPQLQVGDALIFDCRILHFGLGNTALNRHLQENKNISVTTAVTAEEPSGEGVQSLDLDDTYWRPMLYVNYHQPWFHDPKNWNDKEKLL